MAKAARSGPFPFMPMPAAQIVQRCAEDAPVREAGQRILGCQPGYMGFGFTALRDVGEGLHETAVRQLTAPNLDDAAIGHLAFGDCDLSRRLLQPR